MLALSVRGQALLGLWAIVLFVAGFCHCDSKSVEVVGIGECVDCMQNNIKSSQAFSGLRVVIDCKVANGDFKTRGVGELDKEGKFKVKLPSEILRDDGSFKEECFAQLRSASSAPCPTHNGLESSKIIFKSKDNGKHIFSPTGKLAFSPITCTSAFLWPHFKFPPLPKSPPFPSTHPWYKPLPKFHLPPWKSFDHPFPFPPKISYPPVVFPPLPPKVNPPVYKKPLPPPVPIYKPSPKVPIYKKPLPPPVPIYKKPLPPPVPVYRKPLPPPVPVYKKPCPPPVPVYKKPPVPVYKKPLPPPVPVYKKPLPPPTPVYKKPLPPPVPVYKKPLPPAVPVYEKPLPPPIPVYKPKPPTPEIPPIYKKPCPPFPKLPPLPKIPSIPKIPPFYKKLPIPPLPKFPPEKLDYNFRSPYYPEPNPPFYGPPVPPLSSHPKVPQRL